MMWLYMHQFHSSPTITIALYNLVVAGWAENCAVVNRCEVHKLCIVSAAVPVAPILIKAPTVEDVSDTACQFQHVCYSTDNEMHRCHQEPQFFHQVLQQKRQSQRLAFLCFTSRGGRCMPVSYLKTLKHLCIDWLIELNLCFWTTGPRFHISLKGIINLR